ncbi:MAG: EpsI family protein [Puniceicoccales bacterium]|jgi:hypothetical protein|nr:EpsI family protein [Puniceicoccales bacterium]
MKARRIFLIAGAVVLALVVGLVAYVALFTHVEPRITKPIAELIPTGVQHMPLAKDEQAPAMAIVPTGVPGWVSKDLPLAETEAMNEQVNKILQFDQYVYRLYKSGETEITFYIAYWLPGKVTTTDAGVHNPDACWVNSGWECTERKYGVKSMLGTREMKPFEYGVYQRKADGKSFRLPVIFWHIVGNEVNRYEAQKMGWRDGLLGRIDRLPLYLGDLKKYGLNQRREQLFVRITSNKPFNDEFFKDADVVRLLRVLEPLGIFGNAEAAGKP